ncbi:hypothetical protein EV175_006001 [Coemansia sp. RSA 1933]|nr:hypothetical protein EV175_006001 [Coemansia sp. RSA 1933]
MPIYTDTDWDVDFKQIENAGFGTELLPETFDNVRGKTVASRLGTKSAKLGIFHVRRLKNYSGVVIFGSVAHGLVDGYGVFAFANRWAEISKHMHERPTEKVSARVFSHDRAIYKDYRQEGTSSLDDILLKLTSTSSNAVTRFLSSLPTDKSQYLMTLFGKPTKTVCSSFHISTQALKKLQHSVQALAPPNIRYTTNDVLTSVLTMTIGKAIQENNARKQAKSLFKSMCSPLNSDNDNDEPEDTMLLIPTNIRLRSNNPNGRSFVGNMVFPRYVLCPSALTQAGLDPENVLAIATPVREVISSTNKTYIGQFNHLINSEPDMYLRLNMCYYKYKSLLVVTNVSKFDQYKLDFGAGIPHLIRPSLQSFVNAILVMSSHPDIGGYEVVL